MSDPVDPAPAPPKRTRRLLVAGGLAVVLVAVAAGGAYAVARDDDADEDAGRSSGGAVTGVAAAAADPAAEGGPAGLTVEGRARVRVPADRASVVIVLGDELEGSTVTLSARDRTEVLAGLEAVGVAAEAVDIEDGSYTGSQVSVEVAVADLPEVAERVEEAVEDVVGRSSDTGVRFRSSDCTGPLGPARDDAVARARTAAAGLAEAAGVELGGLRSAVELPSDSGTDLPGAGDPCGGGTGVDPFAVDLEAYDAEPELELEFGVAATFAIEGAGEGSSLSVEGVGRVEVDADRATIVVLPDEVYEVPSPEGPTEEERAELVAALADLGIAEGDVRYEADPLGLVGYGVAVVQVEVAADRVAELGEDVVDAVEDVVGSAGSSGVVYRSSRCTEVLVDAQRAGVEDAEARVDDLARATGARLGGITRLATLPSAQVELFAAFPIPDPCDDDPLRASIDAITGEPDLRPFEAPARTEIEAVVVLARAVR